MLLFINGVVLEIRPQQIFESNTLIDSKYVEEIINVEALLVTEQPKRKKAIANE